MEGHQSLTSLMVVVSVAFLVPIMLHKLKLNIIPLVVAEIIAGILIGKSGLNIVHDDPWLSLLSVLGFIYLMFLSGLEIDFSNFDKKKMSGSKGVRPFKIAAIVFGGILVLSFLFSYGLVVLNLVQDVFITTLIISTISLGVVVPVLKEKDLLNTVLGQTVLLIAVISDFMTMILLAFYVMAKSENILNSLSLLLLFVIVFVSYRFIKKFFKVKVFDSLMSGTVQLGTRGVFALILLFVGLSETLGAENILGAFLAGVIVSLLAPDKEFVHQLDSFGYGFLIPIFFVMVGVEIEIQSLLKNPKIIMLIPILLIILYLSKIIPSLLLKKWFTWKEVFSSGLLLTSTLSLVIAAAKVGVDLGVMDEELSNAFILVAVITCFISPTIFTKMIPKIKKEKKKVSIIGANRLTLPVSLDLEKEYIVSVYSAKQNKLTVGELTEDNPHFPLIELPELNSSLLIESNAYDVDSIIVGTGNDDRNIEIARKAKEYGVKQILVRVESNEHYDELVKEGYGVFSTLNSTRVLLRSMISSPSLITLLTDSSESIKEVKMKNSKYDGIQLRHVPFLGDTLILQIYRNGSAVIPHGDTNLECGDKILLSGSEEHIQNMKKELEG
ncbi:cation:proton antiporter family protein [Guptibacillus spartinae]|uniref:cation:proton antiporter family protein n=1 Tax=Guptibacillus spartinae TaxID=3025679 RepID=UPI002362E127|nr:cation:proton antiporter family protein [Pseudalkalibacillus spartinae]